MARVLIVVVLVVLALFGAFPTGGAAQQTGVAAEIRQGNCDELGAVVAPLTEATVASGEFRGNPAALLAANAFSTVPIPFAELISGEYAVVVPFPAGQEVVACGEIGGALTDGGALVIGLRPHGEVGISGIAYLSPGADPAETAISLFITGEGLDTFLAATFQPLQDVAAEDVARFAAVLAARGANQTLAGPFAGELVQRQDKRIVRGAGVEVTDFVATVTFVNPQEQTDTPWDVGLAFHRSPDQTSGQDVVVSSDGVWVHQDDARGVLRASSLTGFDATPGAANTLDLVVDGSTALFGLNGELVDRIELPPATVSDIFVTTNFSSEKIVEGRSIVYTDFTVWPLPGTEAADDATATVATGDAERFAAALAARHGSPRVAGPLGGAILQSLQGLGGMPAGLVVEDFSATVTFVNPTDQSGTPWDFGLAFRQQLEPYGIQEVYLDSNGFWSYTDFPNGVQQSGIVPAFDAAPGAMNTLDLIVQGSEALFGVNGEFLARLELPPAVAADVLAATDFVASNVIEGREIIVSGFSVWNLTETAALPLVAQSDAERFAGELSRRDSATSLARPLAGTIPDAMDGFRVSGAGVTAADFSSTVTFVNPEDRSGVPRDVGFAFHRNAGGIQMIYVDSDGFWYFQGTRAGFAPTFDPAPGAKNVLDLVVRGTTALLGVNGEFVGSVDLPPATASDVYVGTGFFAGHDVEGREIAYRPWEVWE